MASSLGRSLNKREATKLAGCGIGIIVGIFMSLGLGWLFIYMIFSPSLWKTNVTQVRMPSGNILCIGRAHDGDISYNYYVRVRGAGDERLEEWSYVSWSLDPVDSAETAVTRDSRFAAAEFKGEYGLIMVIYDSIDRELWWNADDQWQSTTKFIGAWRQLHAINPRLSAPP
jgi:hypothetical protein